MLYSHHDVYLESSVFEGINDDKYCHFRSKKHRINWTIDFHCVDDDHHNPVALYLRLDVIDRIMKAFSSSNSNEMPSTEHNATSTPPLSASSKKKKAIEESKQISLLDMVRHLNIRLKLQHFVVSSWISRYHIKSVIVITITNMISLIRQELVGFVFYQANMLMDLSMSRHFSKSKAPVQRRSVTFVEGPKASDSDKNKADEDAVTLKMDSLYTDIDIADLYFRDWGVID